MDYTSFSLINTSTATELPFTVGTDISKQLQLLQPSVSPYLFHNASSRDFPLPNFSGLIKLPISSSQVKYLVLFAVSLDITDPSYLPLPLFSHSTPTHIEFGSFEIITLPMYLTIPTHIIEEYLYIHSHHILIDLFERHSFLLGL